MTKKLLFLMLLLIMAGSKVMNVQDSTHKYIPVLADRNEWYEVWTPEFGGYALDHFKTIDTVIINDTTYHFTDNGHYLLEDTTLKKIYSCLTYNLTIRDIVYDFSLQKGDSIWLFRGSNGEIWYYVDSIGTFNTNAGMRKVWYLHCDLGYGDTENPIWVEGIGSLGGFWRNGLEPHLDWWGWGILNCWFANDSLIYKSDFAKQWGCRLEYMKTQVLTEQQVRFFPNPVITNAIIEFENADCSVLYFDVYTVLGKKMFSTFTNSNTIEFSASNIANGQYIYTISDGEKIIYSNIFIVKH